MAQYDFPGKVRVLKATIYNKFRGKETSILNNLLAVDIFEDIYTPYAYCEIMVTDYNKLAADFPFIGEEFFSIQFQTVNSGIIDYQFFLYQQDNGAINSNQRSQAFSLHGVTIERAFDTAKTVSRSYKGSYSSIAGQIYDDYMKKDTGLEFNYEASKSVQRYIPPQITPLKAIEHCRQKAIPNSYVFSPYMFFRNTRGFHFMSLNTLFQMAGTGAEDVIHMEGSPNPDPESDDEMTVGGKRVRRDIITLQPTNKYNTMNKIDRGSYNTHSFSFDLTTKALVLREVFNVSENQSKFQLGGTGEYNTVPFLQLFDNSRSNVVYTPTDFSVELDGTQTDFYADAAAEMVAYANLVGQQQVDMVLYGDSNLTAGQTLTVSVYETTDQNRNDKVDKTLSGTYLLSRVRHNITFDTNTSYELHMTGIKGAMNDTAEGLGNG